MIDLDNLRTFKRHPLKPIFRGYKIPNLAEHLSVSPGHLSNILNGILRPSKELEARITALAGAIQEAETAGPMQSKESK